MSNNMKTTVALSVAALLAFDTSVMVGVLLIFQLPPFNYVVFLIVSVAVAVA